MIELVLVDQQELTLNRSARTQGVVYNTCQEWWLIGMDVERESKKSLQRAGPEEGNKWIDSFLKPLAQAYA